MHFVSLSVSKKEDESSFFREHLLIHSFIQATSTEILRFTHSLVNRDSIVFFQGKKSCQRSLISVKFLSKRDDQRTLIVSNFGLSDTDKKSLVSHLYCCLTGVVTS